MRRNVKKSGRDFGATDFSRFSDLNKGNFHSSREMHKATCADCGNECEVPFEPKEGRPVYCRECFAKHRPPRQ